MASSALRSPGVLIGFANLFAIGSSTVYLRSHLVYNLGEQEARLDEIEGTLRGHIGLIEESLDRLEGKPDKAGENTAELYGTRARLEKDKNTAEEGSS